MRNKLCLIETIILLVFIGSSITGANQGEISDVHLAFNLNAFMESLISGSSCNAGMNGKNACATEKERLIILRGEIKDAQLIGNLLNYSEKAIINRTEGIALVSTYEKNKIFIEELASKAGLKIEDRGEGGEGYYLMEKSRLFPIANIKGKNEGIISKEPIQQPTPKGLMKPVEIDDTCTGFPEGFEGAVWYPSGNWYHYQDNLGHNNGSYFWNDKTCAAYTGSWSGDAILGGTSGGNLSCGANYPNNLTCDSNASWMQYAYWITCTYQATSAYLNYWYQLNAEANYDYLKVLISVDGTNAYGYQYTGLYGAVWYNANLDLKNWYGIGDVTTYSGGLYCGLNSVLILRLIILLVPDWMT